MTHHPHAMRRARRTCLPATIAFATLAGLAACASVPPPNAQMAVSAAAVDHAVSAGANELAPTEIALAHDKMSRARQAMTSQDNGRALALAQEAQADAQLAEAKATASKASQAASALRAADLALRDEMNRQTPIANPVRN